MSQIPKRNKFEENEKAEFEKTFLEQCLKQNYKGSNEQVSLCKFFDQLPVQQQKLCWRAFKNGQRAKKHYVNSFRSAAFPYSDYHLSRQKEFITQIIQQNCSFEKSKILEIVKGQIQNCDQIFPSRLESYVYQTIERKGQKLFTTPPQSYMQLNNVASQLPQLMSVAVKTTLDFDAINKIKPPCLPICKPDVIADALGTDLPIPDIPNPDWQGNICFSSCRQSKSLQQIPQQQVQPSEMANFGGVSFLSQFISQQIQSLDCNGDVRDK